MTLHHNIFATSRLALLMFSASSFAVWAADDSVGDLFGIEESPAAVDDSETPSIAPDSDAGKAGPEINPSSDALLPPEELPGSTDDLFGTESDSEAAADSPITPTPPGEETVPFEGSTVERSPSSVSRVDFSGFWQNELAYTYAGDSHFSKWRNFAHLSVRGDLSPNVKWQVSGNIIYDPIYELNDFYSDAVQDEQTFDGYFHETYLNISLADWEIRLGRQNIVWGEAVGLFFADVVSALDLREFVLPDFELIRIPQWAMRAEHFGEDIHAEVVFIPVATTDEIGEFGGEYFPFNVDAPPGVLLQFVDEEDRRDLGEDFAAGTRVSYLKNGWDVSAFYHTTPDHTAAFSREISLAPVPTITYRGIHQRIHQFGGTLAKDIGDTVLKVEAVYSKDRLQAVVDNLDANGLEESDELRYLIGLDWALGAHTFNTQFFQTWFRDHLPTMFPDEFESGVSFLYRTTALHPDVEPELLFVRSVDRNEWLLEAKVSWKFSSNWAWTVGADIFDGPRDSFLGQYKDTDRVYSEVRFSF